MFYPRPNLATRIHRKLFTYSALRPAIRFAAGVHAANAVAHGARVRPASTARR